MKNKIIFLFGICIMGCEKDPEFPSTTLPALTSTSSASNITSNSARSGGVVKSNGGLELLERGVCWSTTTNPTINVNKRTNVGGLGSFTVDINGLNQGTTY